MPLKRIIRGAKSVKLQKESTKVKGDGRSKTVSRTLLRIPQSKLLQTW
jgi:hypothetical protein